MYLAARLEAVDLTKNQSRIHDTVRHLHSAKGVTLGKDAGCHHFYVNCVGRLRGKSAADLQAFGFDICPECSIVVLLNIFCLQRNKAGKNFEQVVGRSRAKNACASSGGHMYKSQSRWNSMFLCSPWLYFGQLVFSLGHNDHR